MDRAEDYERRADEAAQPAEAAPALTRSGARWRVRIDGFAAIQIQAETPSKFSLACAGKN